MSQDSPDVGGWLPGCVICGERVNLEASKTDDYGQAVHEECYVSKLIKKPKPKFLKPMSVQYCSDSVSD